MFLIQKSPIFETVSLFFLFLGLHNFPIYIYIFKKHIYKFSPKQVNKTGYLVPGGSDITLISMRRIFYGPWCGLLVLLQAERNFRCSSGSSSCSSGSSGSQTSSLGSDHYNKSYGLCVSRCRAKFMAYCAWISLGYRL